ncbi:MAG: T9SS type A sorting domain-containing protein [Bacteroides sp.]|jgi:hypothetical protein|nr:T9SS type A sorting domain-containing protein [Bacteroides sp.]
MKKLSFLLFFLWMIWSPLWGQQIVQAEYFVGEDPGYGNATPISVTAGTDTEMNFSVPLEDLDFGIQTLYVRVKDSNGHWSQTFQRVFLVQRMPLDPDFLVSAMEYFFDEDPGFGQGTPIEIEAGPDVTAAIEIPLETLPEGLHTLYVRTKDNKGGWGLQFYRTFLVKILPQDLESQVNDLEYFFDEDPGPGLATPIEILPGEVTSVAVELPLDELSNGIHTLYVRTKDDRGGWGLAFHRNFFIHLLPNDQVHQVNHMEYFFDEDPGFGLATPIEMQPGEVISVAIELPLEDLSTGLHTLYVRTRDDKGNWGLAFSRIFMKFFAPADVAQVVRMEYFLNNDPGPGNGNEVLLNTPRPGVMKYFVVEPELLQPGTNTLYVRTLDTRGRWGFVHYATFEALQANPCDPPTDLTASDVTETAATLGWTEQSGGTSWDLLWVPNGMDYTEDGTVGTGIEVNPSTVENLFQTTLYDFYVRTACSDGQVSPWAGPASFHTLPLAYNQLSLLADPPEGGTLTGEGSYAFGEAVTITATPNTNFVFQHWTGDTEYLDDPDEATATVTMPAAPLTLTAHFLDVTGISDITEQSLRVFPNPARDQLHIEFYASGKEVILELMNMQGHLVDQLIINESGKVKASFTIADLPEGLYLLVIRSEKAYVAQKVVVRH